MAGALDWINVMTYDFHGGWGRTTGHNAPMVTVAGEPEGLAVTDSIDGFLAGGVPASQLVLGGAEEAEAEETAAVRPPRRRRHR